MTKPLQVNELAFIENNDGLVAYSKGDQVFLLKICESQNGEAVLEVDGERWVLCWVRMPGGGQ